MINKAIVSMLLVIVPMLDYSQSGAVKYSIFTSLNSAEKPEYKAAQQQLDSISLLWRAEVEALFSEADRLSRVYRAYAPMLTDEMKKKWENEIAGKRAEAQLLAAQYFNENGDLFKKRHELLCLILSNN